jgi:hypothetical protein
VYCREHMPLWNDECQAGMVRSLQSHVNVATKSDIIGVLEVERLCSTDEYRLEILRRLQLRLAAEEAQLQAQLKDRQCERCNRRPATEMYIREATCAKCAATARDDASHRAVDERITRLRQERARLGRPRSQSK